MWVLRNEDNEKMIKICPQCGFNQIDWRLDLNNEIYGICQACKFCIDDYRTDEKCI